MKIFSNRFAILCAAFGLTFLSTNFSFSQITTNAVDNASNYSGGWTNGANGGTGFQPWTLSSSPGTGSAGSFIGDPSSAGMSGLSSSSFGLYAKPTGSQASSSAERGFSNSLAIGQTLSFKWAINYDSGGGTNASKGVVLSAGSSEIFDIYNGGSQNISLNGTDVSTGYGTSAMTWSFTRTATNSYRVVVNRRDGSGNFSNNITVANGAIDKIKFYAFNMQEGDAAQPYFNDFLITTTTADVTPPVINLAAGVDQVTWVAKDGTVNLSANDVIATDNSGSVDVTFPSSLNTSTDDSLIVLYTATDGSGNSTSVQRVILVGSGGGNLFYSTLPRTLSVSPLTSATAGGELWVDGATSGSGATTGVQAWVGVNSGNTDPATWGEAAWSPALFASQAGNNDRYEAQISGSNLTVGANHYYATRFRLGTNGGNTNYFYGGIATNGMGGRWDGTTYGSGILTVEAGRLVTYTVDMGVYRKLGTFNPSNHTLQVRTGLNNSGTFSEFALSNSTSDLYSGTFPISGAGGATNFFKFYWAGSGGLEWESDIGDRPLVLSANGVATNAGTNFFNNLEGRRSVSYAVDMSVQKFKGLFNPSKHTLQVRTGLSTPGYEERALTNTTGDLYEGTFAVDGADASTNLFKFYAAGTNGLTWEDGADRQLVLAVTATNQHAGTNFFGNVSESRKITLSLDMSVQVSKGRFDPSTNTVAVASSLDWVKSAVLAPAPGLGVNVYSVDIFADGPLPNIVEYIFSHNGTNNVPNSGYEIGGNRSVVKADINPTNLSSTTLPLALFSRDDGIGPVITRTGPATINLTVGDSYTDAGATASDEIDGSVTVTPSGTVNTAVAGTYTITYNASDAAGNAATPVTRTVVVGSTFAGAYPSQSLTGLAPNGLTYLANYAFGGNATTPATLPVQDTSDPTKLRLVVIYRTDDATLPLNALGGETTAELAGVWSASGVSVANSTDTSPAPANTVRKVISVDRGSDPKKFLRATVTK